MNGLKKKGLYYEGVVADLDDLLENYKRGMVTMWGIRRSSTNMNGDKNGDLPSDLSDRVNAVSFIKLTIIMVHLSGRLAYSVYSYCSTTLHVTEAILIGLLVSDVRTIMWVGGIL